MDFLNQLVSDVNGVLWGVFFLIPLLCGTGIFYTIKLRFVQVRKFGLAARFLLGGASLFGKRADKSGMSSFQAVTTAIAGQVGTGNLAGAATAIVLGGPGGHPVDVGGRSAGDGHSVRRGPSRPEIQNR